MSTEEIRVQANATASPAEADAELRVLDLLPSSVETTELEKPLPPYSTQAGPEGRGLSSTALMDVMVKEVPVSGNYRRRGRVVVVGAEKRGQVWIGECLKYAKSRVRVNQNVRINEDNNFGLDQIGAAIARSRRAKRPFIPDYPNAPFAGDITCTVSRTVVYDKNVVGQKPCAEERVKTSRQFGCRLVGGDYHR